MLQGPVELAEHAQQGRALVAGLRVVRLVLQHGLVGGQALAHGLLVLARVLLVEAAQVEVRVRVLRPAVDGLAEARLRRAVVPLLGFQHAQEVVDGGARGVEPQRLRQLAAGPGAVGDLHPLLGPGQQIGQRRVAGLERRGQQQEQGDQHANGRILSPRRGEGMLLPVWLRVS